MIVVLLIFFFQVKTIPQFWAWSMNTLSPSLFDQEFYNGVKVDRPGYLSDTATFLLGSVRMRQVRVKKGTQPTNCH